MGSLLVGAAKTDICPPLHIPYLGGEPRYGQFAGIHDPLYARAAVFSNGSETVGILSADALGLSTDLLGPGRDFIAEVRRRVAAETDLAPGDIVVERNLEPECAVLAATHAHSTPDTYGILRLWEREDCRCWFETLAGQLASALVRAFRDLSPARLSRSQLQLGGMGANRRMRDTQGRIFSRNRTPQDAVVIDEGCVDETLCVVLAQRERNAPVVLTNYACHPVTLQVQPMMSADYPGVGCSLVEQALGAGSLCLFLQGAAGDVNPVNDDSRRFEDAESFGMTLAGGILQGLGQARLQEGSDDVPLAAARTAVSVEAREAPDLSDALATRDEAVQALARVTRGDPRFSSLYAKARTADETYRLAAFGPGPIGAEVQALRLGDVAVVTFPGELFCRLGLRLKEQSPAAMTMLATCANGCLGYLHPLEAWEHGGYEVGPGAWCRVAPGQPERLVEAAQALLRGLF